MPGLQGACCSRARCLTSSCCQGSREVILGIMALGKSALSTEHELKLLQVVF